MNLDLIIVGDPLPEMQKSLPQGVNVIIEPFGKGYNEALNRGAKKSTAQYLGFCNNDLIFQKGAIEKLVKSLDVFDSVSPWCPKTHNQWWNKEVPKVTRMGYDVGRIVAGWCLFMRRSVWESLTWGTAGLRKGFDERLMFYCCDNAYAEQIKQLDIQHALIPHAHVEHMQSQTLNKLDKATYQRYTRDQIKVFNRIYKKNLFNLGV